MGLWEKLKALLGQGTSDKSWGRSGRGAGDDVTSTASGADGPADQRGGDAGGAE